MWLSKPPLINLGLKINRIITFQPHNYFPVISSHLNHTSILCLKITQYPVSLESFIKTSKYHHHMPPSLSFRFHRKCLARNKLSTDQRPHRKLPPPQPRTPLYLVGGLSLHLMIKERLLSLQTLSSVTTTLERMMSLTTNIHPTTRLGRLLSFLVGVDQMPQLL